MIQREWSRKEPISFPLWRQKERGDVSERKNYGKRTINEIMLAGCNAGKGVAPWECDPRLTRAGGRSRGLQSKAWTGRGPGGRGFLRTCKNPRQPRTSHGRHHFPLATGRREAGDITSRWQPAGRETGDITSQQTAKGLRTETEHCEIHPTEGQFAYQ